MKMLGRFSQGPRCPQHVTFHIPLLHPRLINWNGMVEQMAPCREKRKERKKEQAKRPPKPKSLEFPSSPVQSSLAGKTEWERRATVHPPALNRSRTTRGQSRPWSILHDCSMPVPNAESKWNMRLCCPSSPRKNHDDTFANHTHSHLPLLSSTVCDAPTFFHCTPQGRFARLPSFLVLHHHRSLPEVEEAGRS